MKLDYKTYPPDKQLIEYQNTILKIFNLNIFKEDMIVSTLNEIFDTLEKHLFITEPIKKILLEKASLLHSTDLKIGFMILYSYDFCDIFHPIIQKGVENKCTPKDFEECILRLVQ